MKRDHSDLMQINYLDREVVVDSDQTFFSFSAVPGSDAWQLVCGSSPEGADLWDSGLVDGLPPPQLLYQGRTLTPLARVFWQVRFRSSGGSLGAWSAPRHFDVGFPHQKGIRASWIRPAIWSNAEYTPLLRKRFSLQAQPTLARLYICGLGLYEAWINGVRVGDEVLNPPQTDYDLRAFYSVHEVGALLRPGKNVLGVVLGDGMYRQDRAWLPGTLFGGSSHGPNMIYGERKLLAQLVVDFADGSRRCISSDETWMFDSGPIEHSSIYGGERYDARKEKTGWAEADFDDRSWRSASVCEGPEGILAARSIQPMRRTAALAARLLGEAVPGRWIFDIGQNLAGWAVLEGGFERGEEITLRFAESLDAGGRLDPASTGVFATHCVQTDVYTASGDPAGERFEPRFTWHGFRYIEVSGLAKGAAGIRLSAHAVHTDVPSRGSFTCSDPTLVRLHEANRWTIRSNLHGLPEDCPARERCGWLADAYIAADACIHNFDMAALYRKFMGDIETSRRGGIPWDIAPGKRLCARGIPDWIMAVVFLPWSSLRYYGDLDLADRSWPVMRQVMSYHASNLADGIHSGGRGDWCDPGVSTSPVHTPERLTTTAFFIETCRQYSRMAALLGHQEDAERYRVLAAACTDAFHRTFFQEARGGFGSQTADVLALELGLCRAGYEQGVAAALASDLRAHGGHLTTGIFGHRWLYDVLCRHGFQREAWGALMHPAFPSPAHLLSRGATTMWEWWGDPETDVADGPRSMNHPMFAGYDAWLYQGILGLRPAREALGCDRIVYAPQLLPTLDHASGAYDSIRGRFESGWKRMAGGVQLRLVIPPGVCAEIPAEAGLRLQGHGGIPEELGAGTWDLVSSAPSSSRP